MAAWAVKNFGGMIPRTDPRVLPDNMAEIGVNCDLSSGCLDGLPAPEFIQDLSAIGGPVQRAYRFPDPAGITADVWLPLPSPYSSVVRSPLANDLSLGSRIYWTNPGDLAPHWNSHTNLISSPGTFFDLGITQPTSLTPTVTPTGGTAAVVSRSYVFTYANQFQEESAPSLPSAVVSAPSDATWTISGWPTSPQANPVGYAYLAPLTVNIYRTVTGTNTGGSFFKVGTLTYNPNVPATFVDNVSDTAAVGNPQLISTGWGNPPANLDGLTALPGGMLVGFTGNTIHFCEPNRPHAWPAAYDQSLGYVIVGFGVWQQSLVVLTTGYPSTGAGNSPSNFIFTEVRVPEPCISRGSIITDLMGVYYASQNGLVMLNYFGMQNQTLSTVTKNIWLNTYRAASIIACRHRSQYLAVNGSGVGFLIDYSEQRLGFMNLSALNGATAIWNDEYTGDAYIMGSDKKVYRWDSQNTTQMNYRWRSKQFYGAAPVSIGACQISIDEDILTATPATIPGSLSNADSTLVLPANVNAMVNIYAGLAAEDDNPSSMSLILNRNLTQPREIFRVPGGFKAFVWAVEIVARVRVFSVELGSTMKELKNV